MSNEVFALSAAGGLAFLFVLRWHLSKDSRLDLQYLLIDTETKQLSIFKLGQVLALFVSTWILIRETNHDRLNEWLYAGYMFAWAGVNIANRVISKDAHPQEPKA